MKYLADASSVIGDMKLLYEFPKPRLKLQDHHIYL